LLVITVIKHFLVKPNTTETTVLSPF